MRARKAPRRGRAEALRHRTRIGTPPGETKDRIRTPPDGTKGGIGTPPDETKDRIRTPPDGTKNRSAGLQPCPDPFRLFEEWFRDAENAGEPLPEAMALATATRGGLPSVRVVLSRGVSRGGFVFYTNYNSRKAAELVANPRAAIVFHWPTLERQVRVEGRVRKTTRRESEEYFQTRPRESRLGAWASPQSETIPGRSFLEENFARAQSRFGDGRISCPPFWGGFRIVADCIEFWQGQPHRLHDRLLYRRKGKAWTIFLLAP